MECCILQDAATCLSFTRKYATLRSEPKTEKLIGAVYFMTEFTLKEIFIKFLN